MSSFVSSLEQPDTYAMAFLRPGMKVRTSFKLIHNAV